MTVRAAYAVPEPKFMQFDGNVATVYTPPDIPVKIPKRDIDVEEFRDRFTDAETDAMINLAYGMTGEAIARKLLFRLQTTKNPINLDGVKVVTGMQYLVNKGVLTSARRDEILS